MEALQSIDTPAVHRVCAAAFATSPRERTALLAPFEATPRGWHRLLAEPGVAAALAADVAASVRRLRSRQRPLGGAAGVDVDGQAFLTLCEVILGAARRCAAADDVLADALVADLADVCPLQDVHALAGANFGDLYLTMVDSVLAWVCDAALRLPVPTKPRELAGCDGRPDAAPPGGNAYTAARERVARLAANEVLLRWSVELQRVTVTRSLTFQTRTPADSSAYPRDALLVWTAMAPRQLLTAVPGVMEQLLEAVQRLTLTRPGACFPLLVTSVMALQQLADVDPPRLRQLAMVPRVLAAVATYVERSMSLDEGSVVNDMATMLLPLVALYAPGRGVELAQGEELLRHLVRWAMQPPSPAVGGRLRGRPSPIDAQYPVVAASIVLYVAREALRTGREALPVAVRSRAARAGWRRLGARRGQPALAAAGAQLEALASRSTRGSAAGPPTRFPFHAAARVEWHQQCWTCGCPYRQPLDRREGLLRKCAACKVAAYCGSACASTGWAAGHRSTCVAWRTYQATAAARGGGGVGAWFGPPVEAHNAPAEVPFPVSLSGDWKTDWGWTVTVAARVLEAGLALTDVVVVVELGLGRAEVLPALEYAHRPDAVTDMLTAAAAQHGGRVLRVVVRQHPPLLRSYGPRSLQLDA